MRFYIVEQNHPEKGEDSVPFSGITLLYRE